MTAGRGALLLAVLLAGACERLPQALLEGRGPSPSEERDSEIGRTFERAVVLLPRGHGAAPFEASMDSDALRNALANTQVRYPTILYLHGCAGMGDLAPLRQLAGRGFAIIAPDSFARRFRPLQCRPGREQGGENIFVYDFRLAEVSYALHRLGALPWIDPNRLFLMGTSEGGLAAALYRGDEFAARVIAQWTCQGAPYVRGLAAPREEPVLAIVRADDPWYDPARTEGQRGDCGAFMADRPNSQSLLLPGSRHNVFDDPSVVGRIAEFLTMAGLSPHGRKR